LINRSASLFEEISFRSTRSAVSFFAGPLGSFSTFASSGPGGRGKDALEILGGFARSFFRCENQK